MDNHCYMVTFSDSTHTATIQVLSAERGIPLYEYFMSCVNEQGKDLFGSQPGTNVIQLVYDCGIVDDEPMDDSKDVHA